MSYRVFDVTDPQYQSASNPVNAAIGDARTSGGGRVYLPAGTYSLVSEITVPYDPDPSPYDFAPTIHLEGDGPDVTIVQRGGGAAIHDLLHIERSFTTVSGITFDGAGGIPYTGHGIVIGQAYNAGVNDDRVFRRIQLRNVTVRNAAQRSLYIRGGTHPAPISILCSYADCLFSANQQPGHGGIIIESRNTTHFFSRVSVNLFKGVGIYLSECDGISFRDCHVEASTTNDYPYIYLIGARSCRFEDCWFEESAVASPPPWFLLIDRDCSGISATNCFFIRKQDRARAIGVGSASGPCHGISIVNPLIRTTAAPPASDPNPIWIFNSETDCTLIGGVLQIGNPPYSYQHIEIQDQARRSVHLAPDRRLRLPQLSGTDITVLAAPNRRNSDVVYRDIAGIRTGTGLEAFNGTTWLPLTVNRYPDLNALNAEFSRDRGTVAWIDDLGQLRVFDGAAWRILNMT
jgi:hypothetical protein